MLSAKYSSLFSYLFFLGLFGNLLLPGFLFGITWHFAIFPGFVILILWFIEGGRNRRYTVSKWVVFPLLMVFLVTVSDFYGKSFLGVKGGSSSLNVLLLLIFTFFPYFLVLSKLDYRISDKHFVRVLNLAFLVFMVVSVIQAWGPDSLSEALIRFYSKDPHTEKALIGFRYTLTAVDPNIGAAISSVFIVFYFVAIFKLNNKILYFTMFTISIAPLFFTQGRTVMIGLSICLFLYLLFFLKIKLLYKVLYFGIISCSIFVVASYIDLEYLFRGVADLSEGENNSLLVRVQNAKIVLDNFYESPILGYGANLEDYGSVRNFDSEYLLLLQRHGLLGLFLIVGFILVLGVQSVSKIFWHWGAHVAVLYCGIIVFFMTTNIYIFNFDTFGVVLLILYLINSSSSRHLSGFRKALDSV